MRRRRPDDPIVKTLARRLREARRMRNMTQEALAAVAKMKPETVSRIENAAVVADLRSLARLAAALGVTVGELVDDAGTLGEQARELVEAWLPLDLERRAAAVAAVRAMGPPRETRIAAMQKK